MLDTGCLAGLIIFFSFVTPAVKLLVLLYSETRGHLVHIRKHQYLDLRRVLRQVSKYQMVDVFVGVLTMAFLNHNVIEAHYRSGFYYFTLYCMASIAATQLLDSSSDSVFAPPQSYLILLYMTVSMFVVGFVWALGWPILSWMWEWSQLDVFALALFITLFVFNAFSLLRAVAPWGFYCVLMAAMSGFELAKHDLPPMLRTAQHDLLEMAEIDEDICEGASVESGVIIKHRRDHSSSSFSEERLRSRVDSVASTVTIAKSRRLGSCCRGLVRIVQKLGLPFFVLKAIGWIVFFVIWWVNSGNASLDLAGVNETLKENAPLVTSGLRDFLPNMVGQCPGELPQAGICRDVGPLYHDKSAVMEVLARWLSGLRSVSVEGLSLVVPGESELEMSIAGSFDELSMSLYIGQCITPDNLFRSTNDTADGNNGTKLEKPICSALWDKVYSWKQVPLGGDQQCVLVGVDVCGVLYESYVGWSLIISASCNEEWPYVRNIAIKDVTLDQSLKISEQLVFGITINVDDLTTRFREGFQKALLPYIVSKSPWIHWGADEYDMSELLNQLMDCLSATELRNCSSNAKELRCARRAIEWLKEESKPIQQLPTGEFDHLCAFDFGRSSSDCALPDCCVAASSPEFIECIQLFRAHRDNPTLVGLLCQVGNSPSRQRAAMATAQVLAKWCRVPLVGTTGRLESFAKYVHCRYHVAYHEDTDRSTRGDDSIFSRNEDLCDAVSAAGVVARAFSIAANHDNEKVSASIAVCDSPCSRRAAVASGNLGSIQPQVYGAVRNVERSEVIIVGCLDLLASASPELLLRVAWLELEDIGRRSHVDAVDSTSLFCRCIVLLTELLKNESEAGQAEAGLRCSVEELVNAALDCNFVTWSSDDRQLIKIRLALLQRQLAKRNIGALVRVAVAQSLPNQCQRSSCLSQKSEFCREHLPSVYLRERSCPSPASTAEATKMGCTKCSGVNPTVCTCETPPFTVEVGYGEKCGFSNVCGAGQGICYRPCNTYLHSTLCPEPRCSWNPSDQVCQIAPAPKQVPKWTDIAPFNPALPKSELARGEAVVQMYGQLEMVASESEAELASINDTEHEVAKSMRMGGMCLPAQLHRAQLLVAPATVVQDEAVLGRRRLQTLFSGLNLSVCRNLSDDVQPAIADACASPDLQGEICHEDGGKEFCALDQTCKPDGDCSECGWKTAVDHAEHKCVQPNPTNCKRDLGKNYCPLDSACHSANSCQNCTGYTAIDRVQGLCVAAWWDDTPPTPAPGSDGDLEGPPTWVCRDRRKVGMACRTDMDCIYGRRRCVENLCQPLPHIEATASSGTAAAAAAQEDIPLCAIDLDCGHVGFYCPDDPADGEDPYWRKSCRRQKTEGEDCEADRECSPDFKCNTYETPPKCRRMFSLAIGAASPYPELCSSGFLDTFNLCSAAAKSRRVGRRCDSDRDCTTTDLTGQTGECVCKAWWSSGDSKYCMPVAGDFSNNQERLRDWLYYRAKYCGSFWDERECLEERGVEAEKKYYALLCETQQLSGGPYIPSEECGLTGDDR
ncbi:hypothetical protein FOZ60_006129 [Perkinsus olseni]|uniref:Uncharacterized protein n=1 Tax=Perkinsus olseni TaxID=32597 RepID=A0A7J6PGY6_PEROL|nr:hypothetical protein FOZ60_006129 [Perkinsus olseni]